MTTNNEKFRITADIIIAIVSNSTKDTYDRLNAVPEAFEKIYNKIDELDKRSIPNTTIDDVFTNKNYVTDDDVRYIVDCIKEAIVR